MPASGVSWYFNGGGGKYTSAKVNVNCQSYFKLGNP